MNFIRSLVSAAPDKPAESMSIEAFGRDSMECEEEIVDSKVENTEKKDNGEKPKQDAETPSHPGEQLPKERYQEMSREVPDPNREACSPHFDPMQIAIFIKTSTFL